MAVNGRAGSRLNRRSFLKAVGGGAAAAGLSLSLGSCAGGAGAGGRRVVVIGMDGMDPNITGRLMRQGLLPNFLKLAESGSFKTLRTVMPPQSPVVWSTFITGMNPGGHGVSDFLARNAADYKAHFSIAEVRGADVNLEIGDIRFPISGGGAFNLRRGVPFWRYLTERGIEAAVIKVPSNFPPDTSATRAISGLGTPDLLGGYGEFSYYTTDSLESYPNISGGKVIYVGMDYNAVRTELIGPENGFLKPKEPTIEDPYVNNTKAPFTVYVDPVNPVARIDIQGRRVLLRRGEFSDWVRVNFEMLPVLGSVSGIVRFLLKETHPHLRLYVSPINIDPANQALPITHPAEYGAEIERAVGPIWTKGLPADTKALDHRIFTDEEYVDQAHLILEERFRLFDSEFARFKDGFFFFYFSSTDQDSHMLWRNMDEAHPMHGACDPRFKSEIFNVYQRMDEFLGRLLPAVDDRTLLMICSDHGFAPFYHEFHLNTWLRRKGYLQVKPEAAAKRETLPSDIDWSKTVAYNIGLNGVYLNLKGREGRGIVDPERASALVEKLAGDIAASSDSREAVTRVFRKETIYSGAEMRDLPELLVGFRPGYRCSGSSSIGLTGPELVGLNPWAWSGDHCMDLDRVPGILFANRPVVQPHPGIIDLPVTVLAEFGITRPAQMEGRDLFRA